MGKPIPLSVRFWKKVDKKGPGECWPWKASKLKQGYGHILIEGKLTSTAHRASWIVNRGPIPPGLDVCHTCDNRSCVNPNHLWLGTEKQNSEDMVHKMRQAKGEALHRTDLTNQDVLAIRQAYEDCEIQASIARRFKVSEATVKRIVTRKSWRHLQ